MAKDLDKYLQGDPNDPELSKEIENLSEEDKKELAFQLGVRDAIKSQKQEEIKKDLKDFEPKAKSRNMWVYYAVAASFAVILSVTLVLFDSKSIYESYYEPYPNFESGITRNEASIGLREEAFQAYDRRKYGVANDLFDNHLESNPQDVAVRFFRGICYMEQMQFEEALKDFKLVIEQGTSDYLEAATWYSALSYIQLDQQGSAEIILKDLLKSEDYAIESEEILKKL